MALDFTGDLWHWRGPSPVLLRHGAGRGQPRPAGGVQGRHLRLGDDPGPGADRRREWETSLFPKDGLYVLPVKDAVRRAERLAEGDTVAVRLTVAGPM